MTRVTRATPRFLCAIAAFAMAEAAALNFIFNPPPNEVVLQVGGAGGAVTTVAFNITAANAGTGTAIAGAPANVLVFAGAREAGCVPKSATLTVTTPAGLTSGGDTIPFSTISWTTSDADIASGTYLAPGTVPLATFNNCRLVANFHTFSFDNAQVHPAGTYNGTATYTVAMP